MNTTVAKQEPETVATSREEVRVREPNYTILEEKESFRVEVALPGALKESVKVEQKGDELTVVAERHNTIPDGWKSLHRSLESCTYRLELQLGRSVEGESISANYADGMLTLRVPKRGQQPDRVIEVR
jgi:HSP20 family protein